MFNRERKTHNQARNRELLAESSSHNRIKNIINIEDNSLLKEQVDNYDEIFIHVRGIFISNEDEIEIDCINSMNIAKELKE